VDELINVTDELPNIVRFSKIVKLPLIVCVAFCEPVVKKEAVCEFNVYGDNIEPVWLLSINEPVCELVTKLLVCVLVTNEPVCVFNTKLLVCEFVTKLEVCEFRTNELVCEFVIKLEVCELVTNELVCEFNV
jgi:hypothetical protein